MIGLDRHAVSKNGSLLALQKTGEWKKIKIWIHQPRPTDVPYWRVILRGYEKPKYFLVHRLVLLAFVGPCPPGMETCHKDGNSLNNKLTNLRWDTPKSNTEDRRKHGRLKTPANKGSQNPHAQHTEEQVRQVRMLHKKGISKKQISRMTGIDHGRVVAWTWANTKEWPHVVV